MLIALRNRTEGAAADLTVIGLTDAELRHLMSGYIARSVGGGGQIVVFSAPTNADLEAEIDRAFPGEKPIRREM